MLKYLFCGLFVCLIPALYAQETLDKDRLLEYYQNQKYAEAAEYLTSVYPNGSADPAVLNNLAYLKFMAGDMPAAEQYYIQLNTQDPENLAVLLSLARISTRRENFVLTRKYLEKIVEKDTTNFNVYKQLGAITIEPSDTLIRMKYLLKANSLRPFDPDVAISLSEVYDGLGKPLLASSILNVAIKSDTLNLALLRAKLPIILKLQKYDEVVLTGSVLLRNGDSSTYVLKNTGKSYYYLKDYNNALKMFTAIETDKQTEGTLYFTTLCYRQLKDYKNAIIMAQKTIKEGISPNVSRYYALLGALNESSKQTRSAIAAYTKGLQFDDHALIYYNLGNIYDRTLSNKREAKKFYKKFLSSNIDKLEYKEELRYVNQWIDYQDKAAGVK